MEQGQLKVSKTDVSGIYIVVHTINYVCTVLLFISAENSSNWIIGMCAYVRIY